MIRNVTIQTDALMTAGIQQPIHEREYFKSAHRNHCMIPVSIAFSTKTAIIDKDKLKVNEGKHAMIGLKRGTVELVPYRKEWSENAEHIIRLLKQLLGDTAVDIQHVGSTAISLIHAKPIIDISVAVYDLNDILPYVEVLKQHHVIFRGEVIAGEVLFVMGDDEIRTHHIHIVKWNGTEWNNYINFRDFLNAYPEKAMLYDSCKQKLAMQFPNDRKSYTAGKEEIIQRLLTESRIWKSKLTATISGLQNKK